MMIQSDDAPGFGAAWRIAGYTLLALESIFVARILYEETALTWERGPQMVGFALAHGAAPFVQVAGLLGLPGGLLWFISSLVYAARRKVRMGAVDRIPFAAIPIVLMLLLVPYRVWEECVVELAGPGSNGDEFLVEAAGNGQGRFVGRLLSKGCDVNAETAIGTPLSAAAVRGNPQMIRFLMSKGANVNKQSRWGTTPLMAAADTGQLQAAKTLVELGADPCLTNKDGHTAESLARHRDHNEIAEYLAAQGSCPGKVIDPCANPSTAVCVHP